MASLLNMSGGSLLNKGLPYDAEIEYLESNDFGSRIRLDYIPTREKDTTFELKFNIKNMIAGAWSAALYQAFTNNSCECYRIIKHDYDNNAVRFCHGQRASGGYIKDNYSIVLGKDYTIKIANSSLIVNGINEIIRRGYNGNINENAIVLFVSVYAEIFYFKIYEGEHLVREYIPVRVGQVGYMYDKVTKQLFGNSGTGAFILGPDKTN